MPVILFLDISGGELLVIMIAVFLIFGPRKVPEIARQLGKGMNELKKATSDLTREFQEGTGQVKREMTKIGTDIGREATRLTEDLISGPTDVAQELEEKEDKAFHEVYQKRNAEKQETRGGSLARQKKQAPARTKPQKDDPPEATTT